jgi:hypothetical protein
MFKDKTEKQVHGFDHSYIEDDEDNNPLRLSILDNSQDRNQNYEKEDYIDRE